MISQYLIYFTILLIIANLCEADIKLVQAVIRHAARTPDDKMYLYYYYPNDPLQDRVWGSEEMVLTQDGKDEAFDLGIFLRNRYPALIDSKLNKSFVRFQAMFGSRTVDTAYLVASGFLASILPSDPNSPREDIPIVVDPLEQDALSNAMFMCENYNIDKDQVNADVGRLFGAVSEIQDLYKYLSHHTGVNHTIPRQGWLLMHRLLTMTKMGLPLEPWTDSIFPNGKLMDIFAVEYIIQTYTMRMKRLGGGVWIKEFLDHVDEFLANKSTKRPQIKGYIYSTGQTKVIAILNTLGVYKPHIPQFLNTILFELHEINKQHYVKVIYKNGETLEDLIIPCCETSMCLLSTFRSALTNVTMKNFEEDCGNRGFYPLVPLPESINKTIPKCVNFAPALIISMPLQLLVLIIVNNL